MRVELIFLTLIWSIILFETVLCQLGHESTTLITLSASNFSTFLKSENTVLVNFYAPWCGYCEQLHPILLNVARELQANNLSVKIAKLDANAEEAEALLESENIDGYPTLVLYKEGLRFGEYTGQRKESDLFEYLKAKSAPLIQSLRSPIELVPYLTFLENSDLFETGFLSIVVGYFPLSEDDRNNIAQVSDRNSFHLFQQLALRYELSSFFSTSSTSFLSEYELPQESGDAVIVFTGDKNDHPHLISLTDPGLTLSTLQEKVLVASLPLSVPFTLDTHAILNTIPIHHHALAFYDVTGSDDTFLDMLMLLAPKFKGRIMIVEVNSNDYSLCHYFNIRLSDLPQLILVDLSDEQHFSRYHFVDYLAQRYQQQPDLAKIISSSAASSGFFDKRATEMKRVTKEETEEELYLYNLQLLEDFFNAYLDQSLPRSLQSEEVAAAENLNQQLTVQYPDQPLPLENIVGSQLSSKLFGTSSSNSNRESSSSNREEADVLLYVYAPWCIHCKAIEPVVTELALFYQQEQQLQIYRIDGSKNELVIDSPSDRNRCDNHSSTDRRRPSRSLRVDGFPSFYFFSRYNRSHEVEFLQDRSFESLHGFIEEERDRARQWYQSTRRRIEECHQTIEEPSDEEYRQEFDEMQLLDD